MSEKDHINIWNHAERRKIARNAAPLRSNVMAYIVKHEDCEIYTHQDLTEAQREERSQKKRARSNKNNKVGAGMYKNKTVGNAGNNKEAGMSQASWRRTRRGSKSKSSMRTRAS